MRTLVGLAAVALVGLHAAPAAAQRIMIQPEIGINIAKISDADDPEFGIESKTRTGFTAGVGIMLGLNERVSIGTGGYYSQQGVKLTDGTDEATLELDYLQIPLALGIGFPTGSQVTPFVFGGPMVGLKLSCDVSADGVSAKCEDFDAPVKSTDFGLIFGGGIGIQAGTGMFTLNGWYNLGLTNIDDSPSSGTSSSKPKNRVFGFSVGYAFPLGGGM